MKLTIILPILFLYFFRDNSARNLLDSKSRVNNWLSMKILNGTAKCNNAEDMKYLFVNYENIFLEFNELSLLERLRNVIETIQNCLEAEDCLDPDEESKVFNRIRNIHAMKKQHLNPVTSGDKECINNVINAHYRSCEKKTLPGFFHVPDTDMTIFQLLTVSRYMKYSCEDLSKLQECVMIYATECSLNAKKFFEVLLSPPEINSCKNFHEETLANSTGGIITSTKGTKPLSVIEGIGSN